MKAENAKFYYSFFEGNKRQYIVPVYQRNYDWSLDECKKLFDDIMTAFDKDKNHYIGSIIQVQKDEEYGVKPFIVIDGQQRLTTIYLLLRALLNFENNRDRSEVLNDSLYNNFKGEGPNSPNDKYKLKLKANTNDNVQLIKLMSNKIDEMDKSSNVYKNYEYFEKLISDKIHLDYSSLDIRKGIEKLECVIISLNESHGDDPQVIFERINSTGLPLELDDLVRNYVLMTEINQEELFQEYWSVVEESIPKKSRANFIIDYLNAYTTYQVNEKNSYEIFKLWAKDYQRNEILAIFKKYSKYYSAFIGYTNPYSSKITNILSDLRIINQSTMYTFLMYTFNDFEQGKITEETLVKILYQLLTYSVRRLVCEVPSNSLRGLYKNLYKRIFSKIDLTQNDYYDVFASFMVNELIGTKDEYPSDSSFSQHLQTTKLYRNRKLCRYILGNLENNKSKEKIDFDSSDITIEHILPQNYQNEDWRNELKEDYESTYNTYVDTLGNLTLTGYNSSLSDNSFFRKKAILEKTKTKIAYLNKEFFESTKWDRNVIIARAKRLSNDLKSIFAYPEYSGNLYHVKSTSKHFVVDLDNTELATGATPLYYEFLGERKEVSTYREIVNSVLYSLYLQDEKIIRGLAIEKYKPWAPQSNSIYLTTDESDLRSPKPVDGTDLFFESNLSSVYILGFIKELIKLYSFENDDFTLYCKDKSMQSKFQDMINDAFPNEEYYVRTASKYIQVMKKNWVFDNKIASSIHFEITSLHKFSDIFGNISPIRFDLHLESGTPNKLKKSLLNLKKKLSKTEIAQDFTNEVEFLRSTETVIKYLQDQFRFYASEIDFLIKEYCKTESVLR